MLNTSKFVWLLRRSEREREKGEREREKNKEIIEI